MNTALSRTMVSGKKSKVFSLEFLLSFKYRGH